MCDALGGERAEAERILNEALAGLREAAVDARRHERRRLDGLYRVFRATYRELLGAEASERLSARGLPAGLQQRAQANSGA